jgi:pectin methylesterase-like acyl-CoA thioesterase
VTRVDLCSLLIFACIAVAAADSDAATIISVGPDGQYSTISSAVEEANSDQDLTRYYVVSVFPGTYINDFPHVTRPMTIRIDPRYAAQEVSLKATEEIPNRKGIILTEASLTVDGLTFIGARTANSLGGNAAGIRDQSTTGRISLTIRNSTFLENQNGILTGSNREDHHYRKLEVQRERQPDHHRPALLLSARALCWAVGSLTVRNSLFCGQLVGHDIKSRALITSVLDNMLYDGAADFADGCMAGSTSFAIDVPNAGVVRISGNQIIQGKETGNSTLVAYGRKGCGTAVTVCTYQVIRSKVATCRTLWRSIIPIAFQSA